MLSWIPGLASLGIVFATVPAVAQDRARESREQAGTIVGIVRDTADRLLEAVSVSATAIDTTGVREGRVYTDQRGRFRLVGLAPGRWELRLRRLAYYPILDTVYAGSDRTDTVGFRMRQMPYIFSRALDPELLADTTSPMLVMEYGGTHGPCDMPVDSVYVLRDRVIVTGLRFSPTIPNSYETRLYRSGAGLVLDLQDIYSAEIGNTTDCSRWRATIGRLLPARYMVSVRVVTDPSTGPAHTRVVWAARVNLRAPTRYAVDRDSVIP